MRSASRTVLNRCAMTIRIYDEVSGRFLVYEMPDEPEVHEVEQVSNKPAPFDLTPIIKTISAALVILAGLIYYL